MGLREDEESGEFGGVSGERKLSCEPMAESSSQIRPRGPGSGRKAGWGNFHSQRPGYIGFTFKVVVEPVCWEAEEQNRLGGGSVK